MKKIIAAILLLLGTTLYAQNRVDMRVDEVVECGELRREVMTFLTDGSLQSSSVLVREVSKLKACGLDDYDIKFFGRMESLSGILKRLTKDSLIETLTYGDLLIAINELRETPNYIELKRTSIVSQQLAETVANIRNWEKDILLFQELGASQQVQDKVYRYLRENPGNKLTYQQLLIQLKN